LFKALPRITRKRREVNLQIYLSKKMNPATVAHPVASRFDARLQEPEISCPMAEDAKDGLV
jgi:hypothetical protein